MKTSGILITLLLYCLHSFAQAQGYATNDTLQNTPVDTLVTRVVLIGDAGALFDGKLPVLDGVKKLVPLDKKTTVVYLGDNIYPEGLPDEQRTTYVPMRIALDSQISLINNTVAKGVMIPGNHDWENGRAGGYAAIVRQQRYVDRLGDNSFTFQPKDGCPGPVEISLSDDVILLIMDSQWWLHTAEKPGIESDCPFKTKSEVLAEIEDIIINNPRKLILFACHHPFRSNGIHGGYFGIKQHIFPFTDLRKNLYLPLPGLGSIYPISRSVFGSPQDVKHPAYQNMVHAIENAFSRHPNVLFLAGHEHTLQYIVDSNRHYIVSGSGCKKTRVEDSRKSKFVASALGFATLEISSNKNVRLSFYHTDPDTFGRTYSENIMNFSSIPTREDSTATTSPVYVYKDSAYVAASLQYKDPTGFKKLMLGNNYRKEWSTPVKMKVFNLNKEKGGLKVISLGGGKQTKSLTLRDKNGIEWKLRTIDKDPELAIPANLRTSLAKDVVQDMISASHPYAPLAVPGLARAAGVLHATPEFFFVPDDPALGYYQNLFANRVCLLEKKEPSPDNSNTRSTIKIFNKMIEDNNHVVDQKSVLNARLLDIYIADFDRHFGQWKWYTGDTGKGKIYYPIPTDRDQAFFYSDGLLVKLAATRRAPFLKGFRYDIPRVNWLGFSARDFDRVFLTGLGKTDWQNAIADFQSRMTDSVISTSVKALPGPVYDINGETIIAKLKSRRSLMMKEGMEYYDFINKYVNVLGSNQQEYFYIKGSDTSLRVQVYSKDQNGDTNFLKYDRTFDPKTTTEIRLYGFNDNDVFNIDADAKSRIKFRIIGGRGNDTFNLKGNVKSLIYDLSTEQNQILAARRTKNRFSPSPDVNEYDYQEFRYQDLTRLPFLILGANPEDGLLAGVGFSRRTYGFRKEPYATDNRLTGLYAFRGTAYQIRYHGEFIDAINKLDMIIDADYRNPALNNFFGLGNETKRRSDLPLAYYRTRYKFAAADFMFRHNIASILNVSFGPSFFHYWNNPEDNVGKILSQPEIVGLDSQSVYDIKTYIGGKLNLVVDNTNSPIFPTRGANWVNSFTYLGGLNENSSPLTRLTSDLSVYASFTDPARLIAVLRFGGGHIFSDRYEYFQALNLGQNNFLRGFRKNRFSGSSLLYNSIELRYKLFDINSYILPGAFGLIGFNDVGRVWVKGEKSKQWHNAYGGGIYFLPYNMFIISATVGFSREETIYNVSLGTKLNITF
jgi:hypothetical protein